MNARAMTARIVASFAVLALVAGIGCSSEGPATGSPEPSVPLDAQAPADDAATGGDAASAPDAAPCKRAGRSCSTNGDCCSNDCHDGHCH
jgi:hypothetical protein